MTIMIQEFNIVKIFIAYPYMDVLMESSAYIVSDMGKTS